MLENLSPKEVFYYFEEISKIPRGSYNEKGISDYLVSFAQKRNLECHRDEINNVIIVKEATKGYEDREPVILQGHMDMVCEKDAGVTKDMLTEGLDLEIVDCYVTAKGTTLGGDDGIAIAYALAILDSDSISHPRLEVICTVSEEVGMDGARKLDASCITGKRLINIDSEEEGSLIAGCAGGGRISVNLDIKREECEYRQILVGISGLLGGHSGGDINLGRASAYSLIVRIIRALYEKMDIRLVSITTGNLINVISNSGSLKMAVSDVEESISIINNLTEDIKKEYEGVDDNILVSVEEVNADSNPLNEAYTIKVSSILTAMPQGVSRMSKELKGIVETSINWGVCNLNDDSLTMKGLVRSEIDDRAYELLNRVSWVAKGNGARTEIDSTYPAWQYNKNSPLRDKMCDIYKEMFHKELKVEVLHVGLECGFLLDKIKGVDAIAMGPDILDIHTSKERMDIASVERTWNFLLKVLEEI